MDRDGQGFERTGRTRSKRLQVLELGKHFHYWHIPPNSVAIHEPFALTAYQTSVTPHPA